MINYCNHHIVLMAIINDNYKTIKNPSNDTAKKNCIGKHCSNCLDSNNLRITCIALENSNASFFLTNSLTNSTFFRLFFISIIQSSGNTILQACEISCDQLRRCDICCETVFPLIPDLAMTSCGRLYTRGDRRWSRWRFLRNNCHLSTLIIVDN